MQLVAILDHRPMKGFKLASISKVRICNNISSLVLQVPNLLKFCSYKPWNPVMFRCLIGLQNTLKKRAWRTSTKSSSALRRLRMVSTIICYPIECRLKLRYTRKLTWSNLRSTVALQELSLEVNQWNISLSTMREYLENHPTSTMVPFIKVYIGSVPHWSFLAHVCYWVPQYNRILLTDAIVEILGWKSKAYRVVDWASR